MSALGMLLLAFVVCLAFFPRSLTLVPELVPTLERLGISHDFAESARAAASQLVRPAPVTPAAAPDSKSSSAAGQQAVDDSTETTFEALSVPPALPDGVAPKEPTKPTAAAAGSTSAKSAQPTPAASKQPHGLARVRVHVKPAAKVWVDDLPSGDATPELELSISVGSHVIGVGDEHGQVQRRSVELSAEKLNVVRFELEEQ
jgi:hypothetical protein